MHIMKTVWKKFPTSSFFRSRHFQHFTKKYFFWKWVFFLFSLIDLECIVQPLLFVSLQSESRQWTRIQFPQRCFAYFCRYVIGWRPKVFLSLEDRFQIRFLLHTCSFSCIIWDHPQKDFWKSWRTTSLRIKSSNVSENLSHPNTCVFPEG